MTALPLAFGEPTGEGWTQIAELLIAFALSLAIGAEREVQQKSAGMRTYPLVGVGAALFMLVSKYGFTDVLSDHVILDPSRVAAQIVSGLGFIGGGLIFVRRDAVRGLTTAASVWLTAAVGAAAGAGLPLLAAITTALYFVVLYGIRPLRRWVHRFRPDSIALRVTYLDGRGLLRTVLGETTSHGFAVVEMTTGEVDPEDADGTDVRDEVDEPRRAVAVRLVLTGRGDLGALTVALSEESGVLGVQAGSARLDP